MKKKILLTLLILCAFIMSTSALFGQNNGQNNSIERPPSCTYSLTPAETRFPVAGGTGSFSLTTSRSKCGWTVTSSASWVQITSPSSGGGDGSQQISYQVQTNDTSAPRSATITIEGQTHLVRQDNVQIPCLSLQPPTITVANTQATYSVIVNAECAWTARTVTPWIHILSPGPGEQGSGFVTYTVDANTVAFDRSGSIEVEPIDPQFSSRTHSVAQLRFGDCTTYTLSPSSAVFSPSGGSGTFTVTAGLPSCRYVVFSDGAAFITSGSSGMGFGTVTYTVPRNTKNVPRTARIIVEGTNIAHTITQFGTGCTSASPLLLDFNENGGNGIINIEAGLECNWEATTGNDWITITEGNNGSGGGQVRFDVLPNISGARTGSVVIGGQVVTITQNGALSGK